MYAQDLAERVAALPPGKSITYYTGFLMADAQRNPVVSELGAMARRLSDITMPKSTKDFSIVIGMGLGTLVQRRLGDGLYAYIFVRAGN